MTSPLNRFAGEFNPFETVSICRIVNVLPRISVRSENNSQSSESADPPTGIVADHSISACTSMIPKVSDLFKTVI
jgi:hypothetical protein